jgi:hypothetical protein
MKLWISGFLIAASLAAQTPRAAAAAGAEEVEG